MTKLNHNKKNPYLTAYATLEGTLRLFAPQQSFYLGILDDKGAPLDLKKLSPFDGQKVRMKIKVIDIGKRRRKNS